MLQKILVLVASSIIASNVAAMELQDTQHNAIPATTLQGKWIVLNYWASWCGACAEETPDLNHLYETNLQGDVLVYGVDFDQHGADETNALAQKMGIKYPVLLTDPRSVWGLGDVSLLPTTFIINPQGKVVEKIVGVHTEASFLAMLTAAKKR